MIFPGFPGGLSFFQVFQVEWEPWSLNVSGISTQTTSIKQISSEKSMSTLFGKQQEKFP